MDLKIPVSSGVLCAIAPTASPDDLPSYMNKNQTQHPVHSLQTLSVYMYYRIAVAGILLIMFVSGVAPNVVGRLQPDLFLWVAIFYLTSCIAARVLLSPKKLVNSFLRISLLLTIDAAAILALIHASGGLESGLGFLLVLTAAVTSIFLRGRVALGFSGAVIVCLIFDAILLGFQESDLSRRLFSTGMLGTLIFTTSVSFNYLTEKIRRAATEAEIQESQARNLRDIAQNIVTRMQTGVIVIGDNEKIELINDSARHLLNLDENQNPYQAHISEIPALDQILRNWADASFSTSTLVHKLRPELEIRVNFALLEAPVSRKTILYIEDYRAIKQYAQQLKLASLGRLSASIAHEIRNPLGAMSHAAQLLLESPQLDKSDQHMIDIILKNASRVNSIVNNTLAISRRQEPKLEQIDLHAWLAQYVGEYQMTHDCFLELEIGKGDLIAKIDPSHLRQVLTNLVDNGLRFSRLATGRAQVRIRAGLTKIDDKPYIEIIDDGPGISEEQLLHIYEPFYTTDEKGTGLGLYISKELCEINNATLHFYRTDNARSCFRIDFSHHQRMR